MTPLELPEAHLTSPLTPNHSTPDDILKLNKGPGLMRRISRGSRGAANKLIRRRQSSNHVHSRDHSSGPVIMRQRSDSRSSPETETAWADARLGGESEDVYEEPNSILGLGLLGDGFTSSNGTNTPNTARTQGGIAPVVPSILRKGTVLTKVTKKKRKTLTFVLDTDSAKVFWDPYDHSKRFYIDDIRQIRMQADARNYREEFPVPSESESCWFTIIYADQDRAKGRPVKTMHLIAPNIHIFELWTSTLNDLSRYRHELMAGLAGSGQDEKTLRGHWKRQMNRIFNEAPHSKQQEQLDLAGVGTLCRSLHINCSKNLLRAQFEKSDVGKTGNLSFPEFKDFVRRLKEREDIRVIFKSLSVGKSGCLDLEGFLKWLQQTQAVDVDNSRAHWTKVFAKFVRKSDAKLETIQDTQDDSQLQMSFPAFSAFISSSYNSVQKSKGQEVMLDRPLNEYFISSSHNTYLLGRQVAGSSSTEAYIRALQRACRCVEIDCWDGPDGRPIVSHGRTLTTSVLFSDCICVIGKYAFASSPYPLIISLEVHCNAEQQQVMVDIMVRELGEWLVREPLMTNALFLPSPEELRNKILIKVKAGEERPDTSSDRAPSRRERSFSSPFSRARILDNNVIPEGVLLSSPSPTSPPEYATYAWGMSRGSPTTISLSSATDDSDTAQGAILRKKRSPTKNKSKIINSLGSLGVYTRGLKFNDFTLAESRTPNHVFSIAERTFETITKDQDRKAQLEKHNMRCLMRVYPSAYRLRSTNFDPMAFWRRGVQMVAMNWQTYDLGMQINEAMFASGSDRTGYVLKPKELRQILMEELNSDVTIPGIGKLPKKLIRFSVDIISAQQIPRPRGAGPEETLDPYIEIEMFSAEDPGKGIASGEGGQDASARNGMSGIGSPHRRRTVVVHNNGYNPIFDDKFKLSLETKYPSLVFVRWTVWDSQDSRNYNSGGNGDPLATFTAKLSSLEQGYRHLPLYDHNGDQFLFATLFCKIKKEEPVTVERDDPVSEKVGRFRQIGQALKRTMSVERKASKDEIRNGSSS